MLRPLLRLTEDETTRVEEALENFVTAYAEQLRMFKDIATLRMVALDRPEDRATDYAGGAGVAGQIGMGRLAKRLSDAAQPG